MRFVRDIAAVRAFYDEVFDWPVIDAWETGVMYDTGAATFELLQDDTVDQTTDAASLALCIPDVWSLFERLKDRVDIVFPLRDNSWGDTSFRFRDPEGFALTLFTQTG